MRMLKRIALVLATLLTPASGSISILFDYTYDTGFFSGGNSDRRALLEAAADVFTSRLTNATFDPIVPTGTNHWSLDLTNPTTGAPLQIDDPTLVADTLTIYVGAHALDSSMLAVTSVPGWRATGDDPWIELIQSKNSTTRFEPLGATIAFDTGTNWYFDANPLTLESFSGKYDFFSVAQHEIGHALGFTTGAEAFAANSANGLFVGEQATSLFGGPIPLSVDRSHWANSTTFHGEHLTMDPSLPMNTRTMFGPLEFAVLKDLGYNTPPARGILHVTIDNSAHGTVTAKLLGDTEQELGRQLSIRATPRPGYVFSGWTGDVVSNDNPLYFVMADGMSLQATFVLSPFVNCKGAFYGIFESNAPETNGTWQLKMNAYGRFTGTFVTNGKRRPFAGALDAAGHWSKTFGDGVQVSFDQDLQTGSINGTLAVVNFVASFSGNKLPAFSPDNPPQLAGAYTLVFAPAANLSGTDLPRGLGYAALRVTSRGVAKLSGRFADGVVLSASVPLSDQNVISVSASFARDYLHGNATFPVQDSASDLEGDFAWTRSADSKPGASWPDGFGATLAVTASRWQQPGAGERVLSAMDANNGLANVLLDGGDAVIQTTIVVNPHNAALENPPSACALRISTAPVTGTFRGSFVDAQLQKRSFRGVFLQKQMRGEGYFVNGAVAVMPAP
jgi:uncharacterized repeat protein (TIGR02543 family)